MLRITEAAFQKEGTMRIKTWKAILGAAMMAAVLTACGGSGVTGESSGRAESGAKETC